MTAPVPEVTPDAPQVEPVAPETAVEPDSTTPAEPGAKPGLTLEKALAELKKARDDAAANRVKVKELEPLAKKQLEADEAKKDEVTKANERAQAAEKLYQDQAILNTQLNLAVTYHLPPEDIQYLGSGTPEEMEDRAKGIAAKNAAAAKANPPPTDHPIEGLRPGASPPPGNAPDDSYPESWKPPWRRGDDKESRIIHGQ